MEDLKVKWLYMLIKIMFQLMIKSLFVIFKEKINDGGSQGLMAVDVEKGYIIVDDQIIVCNLQDLKQKWRISRS